MTKFPSPSNILGDPPPRYVPDVILKTDEQIENHVVPILKTVFAKLGKPTETTVLTVLDFLQSLYKLEAFTDRTILSRADDAIVAFLCDIPLSSYKGEGTSVPLISLIDDIAITKAMAVADNAFRAAHTILFKNICRISRSEDVRRFIWPADSDLNPIEKVRAYLAGSPFEKLLLLPVPFSIPIARRLEHTAIVASSGHGKTQLLQSIILNDLRQKDPPSLIVLDSTGQMVKRIQRLAVFNDRLADRILIIDPEDALPPALNMFDMTNERMKNYSGLVREEIETEIIELFNYVFAAIAREMTGRQGEAFAYIVRLMLSIPGATVHTLRELLSDDAKGYEQSKFHAEIEKLDEVGITFFKTFFYSTAFRGTRSQVLERLLGLLRVPVFNRMFSTVNKLDLYDAMQTGKIVLVNTSLRMLKEQASALFGRYIISRTLAAALERAAIDERERKPAFLIIDEAAPYFDATLDKLLTRVRQFKLGVAIAFQHLEQLDDKLRSAISTNTSIKYAGGLGYTDSRFLARDMETTPEFLKAQRKTDKHTKFACYVRSYTNNAVSLTIPFGTLENEPQMSMSQYVALIERNRQRVTYTEPVKPVTAPVTAVPAVQPVQVEPVEPTTPEPPIVNTPEPENDGWSKKGW